ncbi:hypothetical protein ROZALSC1DRAFT_27080 [Rozella allomycis CSF55]|uniref:DUF1764-domain-containing protein n=1 Tax=Rozella allomycis (strain CSF55) TaxID=988480 RepID=A0A075ASV8_ROZAC|nr:hypothetical protein O9G_001606 [Rozella allomycis CSF55]RKP21522.1 hypothetical protein ROZALSC1DRAFT_27080 [Rozella allomycis CSF55]|eukprot:EPZ33255.1 hypothetical protein O9G_001606 [Rozella allomycis CSF55]
MTATSVWKVTENAESCDVSTKAKVSSEIDDIFSCAKKKKGPKESSDADTGSKLVSGIPNKKEIKKKQLEDDFFDARGLKPKKFMDDGLPLFDAKDLKIGMGGNTPLCPFDCKCCY